jgi:hypothetical protein
MSTGNPYQTPTAEVVEPSPAGQLREPVSCGADAGWNWIKEGFALFRKSMALWMGMVVVYMLLMAILSFVPFINIILGIIAPVFTGGFMVACFRSDKEGSFEFSDMFAGFKNQTGPLFTLGLIYIGMVILISMVMGILLISFGAEEMFAGDPESLEGLGAGIMIVALLAMALFIPLAMGMWFSPALIIFHKMGPWTAFMTSLRGCLKNVLPFLIYGIILFVFGVLAAIPFGLGYLILVPVVIGSIYTGYRDIFISKSPAEHNSDKRGPDNHSPDSKGTMTV